MAELDLNIGGRIFRVACADGEERQLEAAAALIGREANNLQAAIGQVPESRMLLMSSLMLGDRHIALEGELRAAQEKIRALEARAERAEAEAVRPAEPTDPQPGLFAPDPAPAIEALARTADQLEALADVLEAQAQ
ncbi:cell division protein ZapA [Pontivivens ytuae]|uniref:Cell division protein ZapA n=1 Tax=Pontivivens ytuae TaxID=2789856 RepID=A0A7S9LR66_9RHOB|nr:cell division protein ZapA [Pontivivens ytuae]QPH53792.1 cell division protein ZapA [Pontivivens ytuae]